MSRVSVSDTVYLWSRCFVFISSKYLASWQRPRHLVGQQWHLAQIPEFSQHRMHLIISVPNCNGGMLITDPLMMTVVSCPETDPDPDTDLMWSNAQAHDWSLPFRHFEEAIVLIRLRTHISWHHHGTHIMAPSHLGTWDRERTWGKLSVWWRSSCLSPSWAIISTCHDGC